MTGLAQTQTPSSCECVECPVDLIAICKYDSGMCKGKCVRISSLLSAQAFTAKLLSEVLESEVSSRQLSEEPQKYLKVIDALLSSEGRKVTVTFEDQEIEVGVGLPDKAIERLRTVRGELSSPFSAPRRARRPAKRAGAHHGRITEPWSPQAAHRGNNRRESCPAS